MTVVEHRPSAQGPMISSARQQAWRKAGVYALPPTRGRNVGRAFSPAVRGLRHRRLSGTMQALPPAGGVSERNRYEVPALSAEIVPYET